MTEYRRDSHNFIYPKFTHKKVDSGYLKECQKVISDFHEYGMLKAEQYNKAKEKLQRENITHDEVVGVMKTVRRCLV